jgi:hypothetical protein
VPLEVVMKGGIFEPLNPEEFKQQNLPPKASARELPSALMPLKTKKFIVESDRKY